MIPVAKTKAVVRQTGMKIKPKPGTDERSRRRRWLGGGATRQQVWAGLQRGRGGSGAALCVRQVLLAFVSELRGCELFTPPLGD